MNQVLLWGSLAGSVTSLGLSALSIGYGLGVRRSAEARSRRVAGSVAREEIFEIHRGLTRESDDLDRRIGRLEAAEMERHTGRPSLSIVRPGSDAA